MSDIIIDNGNLIVNGSLIAVSDGSGVGLHMRPPRDLYFDNTFLVRGNKDVGTGIEFGSELLFDNTPVADEVPIDPSEFSVEGYWIPPVQMPAVDDQRWSYNEFIERYDTLMMLDSKFTKHRYDKPDGTPYIAPFTEHEYYHYKFEPENYTKTIFMQASIHGHERDSRISLYRMIEALIVKRKQQGYTAWQELYKNCRIIIIPVATPWGVDNRVNSIKYSSVEAPDRTTINPNRSYDFLQTPTNEVGFGGLYPFEIYDTRHTRDVLLHYGLENIDYAIDIHDGYTTPEHYWVTYPVDNLPFGIKLRGFIDYMVGKHVPVGDTPLIDRVTDSGASNGVAASYFNRTLGLVGSTCEWLGGIFPYDFGSEQMTHSFELRSNVLFEAYKADTKSWVVNEPEDAQYFHFDYPVAFTRLTMQPDTSLFQGVNTNHDRIISRWDALLAANPSYITKSPVLGQNLESKDVHSYTVGNGSNKVLFIGGVMRRDAEHRIDEYAVYLLAEYLCNDYIVSQSKFLTDLKNNYKIIVLPNIDIFANLNEFPTAGINLAGKWSVENDKAQPVGVYHDVQIVKNLIDANADAKCIITGGEIDAQYPSDFQTQVVLPKNQVSNIDPYKTHLTTNRDELVVEAKTNGLTFMDYAYDNHAIPAYAVQLKVSNRFVDRAEYHNLSEELYLHSNYEAGRRMANIANLFLI